MGTSWALLEQQFTTHQKELPNRLMVNFKMFDFSDHTRLKFQSGIDIFKMASQCFKTLCKTVFLKQHISLNIYFIANSVDYESLISQPLLNENENIWPFQKLS